AQNEDGSVVSGYNYNFTIASSDPALLYAGLPMASWLFLGSAWCQIGVAQLPITLHSFGSQTVTFSDSGSNTIMGTEAVEVGPARDRKSGVEGATEGTGQTLTLTAENEDGSTASGYSHNFLITSSDLAHHYA